MFRRCSNRVMLFAAILGVAATATIPLVGCDGARRGYIDAKSLDGVLQPVVERHNAYVAADPNLTELEREHFKASADMANEMVKRALERAESNR